MSEIIKTLVQVVNENAAQSAKADVVLAQSVVKTREQVKEQAAVTAEAIAKAEQASKTAQVAAQDASAQAQASAEKAIKEAKSAVEVGVSALKAETASAVKAATDLMNNQYASVSGAFAELQAKVELQTIADSVFTTAERFGGTFSELVQTLAKQEEVTITNKQTVAVYFASENPGEIFTDKGVQLDVKQGYTVTCRIGADFRPVESTIKVIPELATDLKITLSEELARLNPTSTQLQDVLEILG
jgi:vacuolar-type H+-ATPase subunit E/Vma4